MQFTIHRERDFHSSSDFFAFGCRKADEKLKRNYSIGNKEKKFIALVYLDSIQDGFLHVRKLSSPIRAKSFWLFSCGFRQEQEEEKKLVSR